MTEPASRPAPAVARPQPRPRAGPGHRGRRDGRRPLGRPRRQERRRRRRGQRDAGDDLHDRHERHRRHRRGREGQRPDALQRRAGRRRHRPRVRRRGRPDRRHDADRQGHEQRGRRARGGAARHRCTTRPRSSTWRSSSPAPRRPTSSTSATPSPRTSTRSPRPRARSPSDVTVVLLDRPRHAELVDEIRATGARIKFITDGDVAGAIMAARPDTGIDLLLGVGGTPEGIITACAMKCAGRRHPGPALAAGRRRAAEGARRRPRPRPRHVLTTDDLVTGDDCFFVATGITDGELLRGVRYRAGGCTTALAGDALAQRHDPHDHLRAPAPEATRFRLDRLRQLSALGGRSSAAARPRR